MNLSSWLTNCATIYARDVQINDTAYRRLDAEFYAWLRSRMRLARMASDAGRLEPTVFAIARQRFNSIHDWAMAHVGEQALTEAIRVLDARRYIPPTVEIERPGSVTKPDTTAYAEAAAAVDLVRERALALGWTLERLYGQTRANDRFCGPQSALACLLTRGEQVGEITRESIEVILRSGVRQRVYNHDVEQPWRARGKK